MTSREPHVVILGGGFAGLYAAKALRNARVRITLVDRQNHHLFQPLLYQVATAGLSAIDIAAPIRQILRHQKNLAVLMASVRAVDVDNGRIELSGAADIDYDFLIVATGATHSYFGNPEWSEVAPGLKTIEDALEIRRRILTAFERAELEDDAAKRAAWLTFVIVGAGPTGAELAGALAEIARHTLIQDFRHFNPSDARILLLEGGPRVLSNYPEDLSRQAEKQLGRLGVEVQTNTQVTSIDWNGVMVGDRRIASHTVLWAAGVAASEIGTSLGAPLDRAGRVLINPDLTLPGHAEVFVVGDLAHLEQDGEMIPGVAPAAIQEGKHAASNIRLALKGQALTPFRYVDRGSMATIGRKSGVGVIGSVQLSGFSAWLSWLFIHIFFLIGFRNRLVVMFEWSKSYFTFQRSARLILHESKQPRGSSPKRDLGESG